MDANNQNNPGEAVGNNVDQLPVQPRQPQNLQGLLRFAIEARQDNLVPDNVEPLDNDRRAFLAEALQNMVMDSVVVLRLAIPVLTDAQKMNSLANKNDIPRDIKAVFDSVFDIIEDIDVANDFCRLGGFDIFPLCYSIRNPQLLENTNNLLAGVCQNFPPGQAMALEQGLLWTLLDLLREPELWHKEKYIYALSCSVRGYAPACRALLARGGAGVLAALLHPPSPPTRHALKAAHLLRHLLEHYPAETKEKVIPLNLPKLLVAQLDQPLNQNTEHLLHFLKICAGFPEMLSQCSAPELELKRVLQKILTFPSVMADREQYYEIIQYGNQIMSIVYGNDGTLVYDCEEEADR